MIKRILLAATLAAASIAAQAAVSVTRAGSPYQVIFVGATLPATCQIGDIAFDSDATAGQNIYGCTAANTWTLEGDGGGGGGGGSPAGSAGDIQTKVDASTFGAITPGTGVATFLATPSGANLASALTTALPATKGGTGLTSLGTGVATALGVNVGSAGAPVVLNGALGTPSSGTLTSATGLPISTGVTGLGTGVATVLGTPSSANLAAALTDETGSGAAVFATSPTLVTPTLGVASATSVNKMAITAPATSSTLAVADGKTFTVSNTLTLTGTDASSLNIQTGGTLATCAATPGVGDLAYFLTGGSTPTCGLLTAGAAGKLVMFNGTTAAPIVSTTIWPNAVTSGGLLYGSAANTTASSSAGAANAFVTWGGTGTAPNAVAITGLVLGNGASAPSAFAGSTLTAGQFGTSLSASGALTGATLSAVNAQTSTYQVLAADFSSYKTITVASGTFTITLVASGSQPAAGQYIRILNYGSGVVTIARSGQNINGGTSSLTLTAGSATAPTSATIISDGTDYYGAVAISTGGAGSGTVTNTGTLTAGSVMVGNGGTDSKVVSTAALAQAAAANIQTSFTVFQQGIPMLVPGTTGTVSSVGAFTLGTSLPQYVPKLYMYLPAGTTDPGDPAGWYYTTMSSTSAGVIFRNSYTPSGTPPTIPGSPTATTAATTWTGVTTAVTVYTFTVPANSMGANGKLVMDDFWLSTTNNANSKTVTATFGAFTAVNALAFASSNIFRGFMTVANAGATNAQIGLYGSSAGVSAPLGAAGGTVDTTSNVTFTFSHTHTTATDDVLFWPVSFHIRYAP